MASDSRARLIAYLCRAGLSTARANAVLDDYTHSLAEKIREDIGDDITAHTGFAEMSECEGCATVRAANLIDPAVKA
ncbi:hypothetical protein [Streptomyces sp. SS07]|uniref:hypothetical protein n=1 Tax=Streptomyces sp. SS07 TaxID=2015315 RepID=UPI000B5C426E|nr:hypothetical protein [Streptomyces sp. SS07]